MQAYSHIKAIGGGKIELWNGETGWPSDGLFMTVLWLKNLSSHTNEVE
jgi:exo-beta-1,3-glucanase (GH17 family)